MRPAHISSEKAQYQYQPLPGDESIRILILDPGKADEPLRGALENVSIDSAGSYEAVSYVWRDPGPPNTAYEILIREDDDRFGVLKLQGGSIFAALCRLRLSEEKRRVWADQCCINQDDLVERSQQVKFMNRIYRHAARVLVWLGLDTKQEAFTAFSLVHELNEVLNSRLEGGRFRDASTKELERHVTENHLVLQALTGRPWFRRGWVVQEIGTGAPATVFWGDASIKWGMLASVCERLKIYHRLRSALQMTTSDVSFLYRRFIEPDETTHHANRFNFVYELQRARHLRFSDDRDRVFAFLGHYSVHSRHRLACGPLPIEADYTKTVEETYINVALRILQQSPVAACIMLASVQHAPHSLPSCHQNKNQTNKSLETWFSDKHRLPSWVPDWRWSEGIILAEPICPHYAHGDSTTKIEIIETDALMLHVQGVDIDTIEACSRPLLTSDLYGKKSPDQASTMIEQLWTQICGNQDFNLKDRYLNGDAAFFAFMQTLSNGCVQAAGHMRGRPYHEISDLIWLRKAARYIVETFGSSVMISDEIRREAEADKPSPADYDNWSRWASAAAEGRTFARTRKGYYVLGPSTLEPGDMVCVFFGCKVPFCLRPMGKNHVLVGECYVHGLMKGEAMDMLNREELHQMVFELI